MSSPTPTIIKSIALVEYGYIERREEVSNMLFFKDVSYNHDNDHPTTLINIFYTTRGVMTKISHPSSGYTINYDVAMLTIRELCSKEYSQNPRIHTGKGYWTTDDSVRGCAKCGLQKCLRTSAKISGGKVLDTLNAPVACNAKERERLVVSPTKSVGNQWLVQLRAMPKDVEILPQCLMV